MIDLTKKYLIFLLFLLCALSPLRAQDAYPGKARGMIEQYMDLIITDNYESAFYLWTKQSRERSLRFGINYTNIPLKTDAGSPLLRFLEVIRYQPVPPKLLVNPLSGGAFDIKYSQFAEGEVLKHHYFVRKSGGYFRLIYPQDYYCSEWEIVETRFLRIHVHPDVLKYMNAPLLTEVDNFVARMSDSLGVTQSDLDLIEEKKIEFFYCDTDKTVETITGSLVKGTLDLASNDIISAGFPHFHELVHLLVNIRLKTLPLYTLPLFREGVAVHFGGRWGKTAEALTDLSAFLFQQKLVELDSILTMDGFSRDASADIAYPVAGSFTGFLIERIGIKEYFRLYRKFSGDLPELRKLSSDSITTMIAGSLSLKDWASVLSAFNNFLEKSKSGNRTSMAGPINKGKTVLSGTTFKVKENDDWIGFEFSLPEENSTGSFLFGSDSQFGNKRSRLFDEQFSDDDNFAGYRFGIRYDQNEVGLYDYATNQLVAKYIRGISPSAHYMSEDSSKVLFHIRSELLGKVRLSKNDFVILNK